MWNPLISRTVLGMQYFFKAVLREAIRKSKLPANCKRFSELPSESPFAQVITALPTEVKTNRSANKTKQWFNETQGSGAELHYRFTGKDSCSFCHNLKRLIKWLSCESDARKECQTILAVGFLGVRLRDCVSLFNTCGFETNISPDWSAFYCLSWVF